MEHKDMVADLINNIVDSNNVAAKDQFDTLISTKLTAALDAKKQELSQTLYQDNDEQGTEEQ